MQCPECKFQNLDGMKFCGQCGSKLVLLCPGCRFENPDGYSFCGQCGEFLSSEPQPARDTATGAIPSFDKQSIHDKNLEKIQDRFSNDIKEKISSQNKKLEGEYKQVTILFCDMKNFTPLVEELGPEKAYNIMDQVYEILINKIHYYDGIVNEMTGDGVLALFGAPKALENTPQRAVRSSIEIHRGMLKLNNELKKQGQNIPVLKMRIGINSGPVVVGSLGNDLKSEFKVVGDTVNLAARLEGLAEPGTTNVSQATFKLVEGIFRFESLGEMEIKGKKKPEKVYRLISSSSKRTRFDVSAEQGLTPLVGRERELELLIDGFERIKSNNGQIFTVVSEAGIGKSRLLYEFRKAISNEDVFFLEGRCLSYSKGISYHLIIDILKSNFNIQDDDDNKIREKISRGLKFLGIDEQSTAPYFLELLSVKDSGINTLQMSPDAMKDKVARALKLIIQNFSEIKPLVLMLEDLHWADQSSIEIINQFIEIVPGARVLMIVAHRPEFISTWGRLSYHSQVTLYKLTTKQISAMVDNILKLNRLNGGSNQWSDERSNDEFLDFIVAKTEGIPFFIEEFIKYLKDQKLIEKKAGSYIFNKDIHKINVPSTIQDVIHARVDSLPEKAKEILKIASAVEREFSSQLIINLVDCSESELVSQLAVLKESELIFERGIFPKSIYVFKHALIRDIIYASILSDQKKRFHEKIGFTIEELFQNSLPDYFEILAEHFTLGENFIKGAEYSRFSCKKMLKTASPHSAINHALKRIKCLGKLKKNNDIETQMIAARTLLGLLYTQKNYHMAAMKTIQPIISIAEKKDDKQKLSQIYTILGAYQYIAEDDFSRAFTHLQIALKLSEDSNDTISNMQASYWLGLGQAMHCEFQEAEYNLTQVLQVNQVFNILWGISSLKSVMSYFIYYYIGNIGKGFHASLDAIKFANENQDIYSKAMAHVAHGVMCYCKGFFNTAENHLIKGVKLCERSHFFTWNGMGQICLGEINYEAEKYDKSFQHFNKLIDLTKKGEISPSWLNFGRIGAIRAQVAGRDHDVNLELLTRYVNGIKIACFEGSKSRFLSEIFFNLGTEYQSKSEDLIQKAIQADTRNGMNFSLGKDYYIYSQQLVKSDDHDKAKIYYKKAEETFQQCGADKYLETIDSYK
jgi:class 3 adenylate cyclase/tetratricopeptide (TPR) repeat protein